MQTLFQEPDAPCPHKGPVKAVLVPYPVDRAYDYAADGHNLRPGDYVTVPLGPREVLAVVWGEGEGGVAKAKIKSVLHKHDLPPLPQVHRDFLDWVSQYTMAAKGSVLKLTLSVPKAFDRDKPAVAYLAVPVDAKGLSPQRKKVLNVLADGMPRRAAELAREAGCTPAVVKAMAAKGFLKTVEQRPLAPCCHPAPERKGPDLSYAQSEAAKKLREAAAKKDFQPALLDGVTGSGKTEVYFEAVAAALEMGKQILILLPEIALSNAFLDRFKERFGCAPALWHSALSSAQRRTTWRGVAEGDCKVVIGARSALFLPFADLGLIVVDEEHDPAYKQEDNVIYHARDMAVVRAHLGKMPIVLVSATPSLETIHNAWMGRYAHITLPDRHGGAELPDIRIIDLRSDKPERQHFISPTLEKAMADTFAQGGQSMLFLNRRGYAPLTLCRTCGHRFECPRCTAWLIEHKRTGRLHCHHCDYHMPVPAQCPSCDDRDSFSACGPGVERILEEVHELFPQARTCVLASDTVETDNELRVMLSDIRDHKIDIVVGTQIIAKGHHFPKLTCVGVIDADLGLSGGDLRASERTYQLLHQVAGRAGREKSKGLVYLQTFNPDNRVIRALASGSRDDFLHIEALERERAKMPPFTRLVGIILSGREEKQVEEVSRVLAKAAPHGTGLKTLGPAEAPLYRIRGNFRRRFLVCADKKLDSQKAILRWIESVKIPSAVRVHIDIDPQSFL